MPIQALTVEEEIQAAREYCGAPPDSVLSQKFLTQTYLDVCDRMAMQAQLSDRPIDRILKVWEFSGRSTALADVEQSALPSKLLRRPIGSISDEGAWRDVVLDNLEDFTRDAVTGKPAAAMYGIPWTLQVNYEAADYQHQLIYIPATQRPTELAQEQTQNEAFSNLRKLATAKACLPRCLLKDPVRYQLAYSALAKVIDEALAGLEILWFDFINKEPDREAARRGKFNRGRGTWRLGSMRFVREDQA